MIGVGPVESGIESERDQIEEPERERAEEDRAERNVAMSRGQRAE